MFICNFGSTDYLKSAEIKNAEYFRILFDIISAKIYTHRNKSLYGGGDGDLHRRCSNLLRILCRTGPGCSKLTTSLVTVSLKFQT